MPLGESITIKQPTNIRVKVVKQPGHGFVKPCIAYIDADGKYHLADRRYQSHLGTILISRIIDADNFEVAILSGVFTVEVLHAAPNQTVYLDIDGQLTCQRPTAGQLIVRLGDLQEIDQFFWNPDKEQEWSR